MYRLINDHLPPVLHGLVGSIVGSQIWGNESSSVQVSCGASFAFLQDSPSRGSVDAQTVNASSKPIAAKDSITYKLTDMRTSKNPREQR